MNDIEHNLPYYESCFRHLKMAQTRGQVAPHKPLLLLAVIDLIEAGIITSCQIDLSDELVKAFERNAKLYADNIVHFRPNIGMPFFHMKSEQFWRLIPQSEGFKPGVTTISGLRRYYRYAEIDQELFDLLKNKENVSALRAALIETISQKEEMNRPSLKEIYSSIDVLRNIGVEPSEDQLSRLSQYEEELLQQACKAFIQAVNSVRRPFMLQLDYEPDKSSTPTIVIDDKALPIVLPEPEPQKSTQEVSVAPIDKPKSHPHIIEDESFLQHSISVSEPKEPVRHQPQSIKPIERYHQRSQIESPRIEFPEIEPKEVQAPKPSPGDDFFSSLYSSPVEESKPKRTRQKYSLNGSRFMKKEELVFEIIKLYIKHHPKATFKEMQQVFKDDYCSNKFRSIGFLVSEDDLENWYFNGKYGFYHGDDPTYRLVSGDGVVFYHYAQWTHDALIPIIELAESLGYRITTDKD